MVQYCKPIIDLTNALLKLKHAYRQLTDLTACMNTATVETVAVFMSRSIYALCLTEATSLSQFLSLTFLLSVGIGRVILQLVRPAIPSHQHCPPPAVPLRHIQFGSDFGKCRRQISTLSEMFCYYQLNIIWCPN